MNFGSLVAVSLLLEECLAPRQLVVSVTKLVVGVTVAALLCDEHRRLSDSFWKPMVVVSV